MICLIYWLLCLVDRLLGRKDLFMLLAMFDFELLVIFIVNSGVL